MGNYDPTNNPMAIEQYASMPSEAIRSSGLTIQTLITRQLDRIDFLLTLGTAKTQNGLSYMEELQIINAVQRGLRSIESYLSPFLVEDKEYYEEAKQYKAILNQPLQQGQDVTTKAQAKFNAVADWTDLLVSRFNNVDLLPQKRTTIDLE